MTGLFWKGITGGLIGVILCQQLKKQDTQMETLLSIALCIGISALVLGFLEPVLYTFKELETLGGLDRELAGILMKALGISLSAEIAASVCTDGGNASIGKLIGSLGTVTVLYISLPLIQMLLEFLRELLGGT